MTAAHKRYPCSRRCCTGQRARRQFVCSAHWSMITGPTQRRIAEAARRGLPLEELRKTAHAEIDQAEREHAAAAISASQAFERHQRLLGEHDFAEAAE